jgi:acetyl esterase/lipase
VLVFLLVLVVALISPAAALAEQKPGKPPILLIFHGGGFIGGEPSLMESRADQASHAGFEPRSVDYRAGDSHSVPFEVKRSFRVARRLQSRGREVYAYGESAGGLLAARLAQEGLVGAAAIQSPVSNLPKFITALEHDNPGFGAFLGIPARREQRRFSPHAYRTDSSILALAATEDPLSKPTLRWAKRDPEVEARRVPGPHLHAADEQGISLINWLLKQHRKAGRGTGVYFG